MEIIRAKTPAHLRTAHRLFVTYAQSLDFELCFQNFDAELQRLGEMYGPPGGVLFLALEEDTALGCVAVRKFSSGVCEMKRLFVLPEFRKSGAGRMLAEAAVAAGREMGYASMRLDTVPSMHAARALYESLGFRKIESYRENPVPGALFFELDLLGPPAGRER